MLSEGQRRKAASLSIFSACFLLCVKIGQAVDTVPDAKTADVATQGSASVSSSEVTNFLKQLNENATLNREVAFEETAMVKYFPNYQIPEMVAVSKRFNAEKMLEIPWLNEAAESAANVASQVASTEEKIFYRPSSVPDFEEPEKAEEIESQLQATTSTNTVEENVEDAGTIEERGTIFFYVEPTIHTEADLFDLAAGIHGEAGNQDALEKFRVGNAMVNRFEDKTGRFPQDTMHGILYAPRQFGCTRAKNFGVYTEEELLIAQELLNGKRVLPKDVVYFNDEWIDGYFYCKPGYHCFSGYLDHNGDSLIASAKNVRPKQTETKVEEGEEVVQEEVQEEVIPEISEQVDNFENGQECEIVEIPESEGTPEPEIPEQQEAPPSEET